MLIYISIMGFGKLFSLDYRSDLDALRAVAVLSVIFFHLHLFGFTGGYVGVDIFFVISGFLITRIVVGETQAGNFSLWYFYERRVRRLIPSLYVMLAMACAAAALLFSPADLVTFADSLAASLAMGANIFFFLTNSYF